MFRSINSIVKFVDDALSGHVTERVVSVQNHFTLEKVPQNRRLQSCPFTILGSGQSSFSGKYFHLGVSKTVSTDASPASIGMGLYHLRFNANNTIMLLIKLFRIGPVTGPRLAVLDRGRGPIQLTEDL